MKFGKLDFTDALQLPDLLARPTYEIITNHRLQDVLATSIDSSLADTAAFCEAYDIGLEVSANCVVVEAKRGDKVWYAACVILATNQVDVNGVVRRHLEAKKLSFAPMQTATSLTGMEYGGITPIGLPEDWPLLVDEAVTRQKHVIIGSGIRGSKLLVASKLLANLPNATVKDIAKKKI